MPIRLGQVVQTLAHVNGVGGVYEPLVVTPAIGVRVEPEARILPLDGSPLPVSVTIHARARRRGNGGFEAAGGLALRSGAAGVPPEERRRHASRWYFRLLPAGDVEARAYTIEAVAHADGKSYSIGWQSIGYPGLRPYNQYQAWRSSARARSM